MPRTATAFAKRSQSKRWARDWDSCRECGTTERAHLALGRCVNCRQRIYTKEKPECNRRGSLADYYRHHDARKAACVAYYDLHRDRILKRKRIAADKKRNEEMAEKIRNGWKPLGYVPRPTRERYRRLVGLLGRKDIPTP